MFGKRKRRVMDPGTAHKISFGLDVSRDEIAGLIEMADERGLAALSERLARHRDALSKLHAGFSAKSDDLQELADQTEAIASDIAEIEQRMEVRGDDQSFHCYLASSTLSIEARIARGEIDIDS
jgi:hypothetical protein